MTRAWVTLIAPAVLVGAWALLSGCADYDFLPSPRAVLTALVELASSGELARAVSHTLRTSLAATVIAVSVGGALGLAIGLLAPVRSYLMATIDFLRTLPAVALVPVALLTLGPRWSSELALATFAATWPVVIATAAGVAATHPRHRDVARTLHLTRRETVVKLVLPAAVPGWLVGAQLAAVVGFLVAIVAELMMYRRGLGGGLIAAFQALAPARMWAYVVVCGLLGVLVNAALRAAVRRALPATTTAEAGALPVGAVATPPAGLLPLLALLALWQFVAPADSVSFPPPSRWIDALGRLADDGTLAAAAAHTVGTYLGGLLLAAVVGTTLGAVLGSSPLATRALGAPIDFVATIPAAALVPLVALLIGPTPLAGVLVTAVVASFPVVLGVAAARRAIPVVRLDMARSIGLTRRQRWRAVIAPSLVPGVLLGVRVASALAIIVTLLVDVFGTGNGIGRLLVVSQQHFDAAAAWGLLLVVGAFGYVCSLLVGSLRSVTWNATAPGRTATAAASVPGRRCRPS